MRNKKNICRICGSSNVGITYDGIIRDGGLGKYTSFPVKMRKCEDCDAIWHDKILNTNEYYTSTDYRLSLENTTEEKDFYKLHDKENLDKFKYTGTEIFRGKTVADVGCGCGSFLDFIKGAAKEVVAIEPSEYYRNIMKKKGFSVFPYTDEAYKKLGSVVDIVVSFDVIEHVDDPRDFLLQVYNLLNSGGRAIIGTPTETPVMRNLIGEDYERKLLFSTQHIWVLGEKNLKMMASDIGFHEIGFKYFQRYGLSNLIGWVRDREPKSEIQTQWITKALDDVYKAEIESLCMSDYIVFYGKK